MMCTGTNLPVRQIETGSGILRIHVWATYLLHGDRQPHTVLDIYGSFKGKLNTSRSALRPWLLSNHSSFSVFVAYSKRNANVYPNETFQNIWQAQNYSMINSLLLNLHWGLFAGLKRPKRQALPQLPKNAPVAHTVNTTPVPLIQLKDIPELSGC
jgi:hypothetical protein